MSQNREGDYHNIRLSEDRRRDVLWCALSEYLQRFVPDSSSVLDFGAGYCGFVNEIKAGKKFAYDQWQGIRQHANADVTPIVGPYQELENQLEPDSLDIVFASNVFEHFTNDELVDVVALLRSRMKVSGRLILVQPNFYYAYRRYFDDYTHKSIWTHRSLPDFLTANGFSTNYVRGDFMPLTVKSRLPVNKQLIRAYLRSPIRPMAGQMLVVADKV